MQDNLTTKTHASSMKRVAAATLIVAASVVLFAMYGMAPAEASGAIPFEGDATSSFMFGGGGGGCTIIDMIRAALS